MWAELLAGDEVVASAPLAFAGEVSTFHGALVPPAAGSYRLRVLAAQAEEANFGRAWRDVEVAAGSGE